MRKLHWVAFAALISTSAMAEPGAPVTKGDAATEAERPSILDAIDIPKAADRARKAGIPVEQVEEALGVSKKEGATSRETREILDEAGAAAEEHGPTDNFGAFVQQQLRDGKRGRDLAAAIRAEHQANGKGKPDHAGGPPEGKGKPDHAGGPPEGKGKPGGDHGHSHDEEGEHAPPPSKGAGEHGHDAGGPSGSERGGGPPAGKGKPMTRGK